MTTKLSRKGPCNQCPVEDTFEHDLAIDRNCAGDPPPCRKLWSASRKESRIARTAVLKLNTSEFKILTRSHTSNSPLFMQGINRHRPDSETSARRQRFRLVGVGLSNFPRPLRILAHSRPCSGDESARIFHSPKFRGHNTALMLTKKLVSGVYS